MSKGVFGNTEQTLVKKLQEITTNLPPVKDPLLNTEETNPKLKQQTQTLETDDAYMKIA